MPLLILAHPGHELRLFHWMERMRPLVFILTDGSGGLAPPRTTYSLDAIRAAGGRVGRSVMGRMPDRAWYAALRGGDMTPFLAALTDIAEEARDSCGPSPLVVADPVEGYNPMHDLCSALADGVAARLGPDTRRLTFDLTETAGSEDIDGDELDDAALSRKRRAILDYAPLAEEARRLLAADPKSLGRERLLPCCFDWPAQLAEPPAYEAFGQARVRDGLYDAAITYGDHVLPVARALRREARHSVEGVATA